MRPLRLIPAAAVLAALVPGSAHARAPVCQDRPGRELAHSSLDRVLETRQRGGRRNETTVRVLSCRYGSRAAKQLFKAVSRDDLAYRATLAAITPGKYATVAITGATASAGWVNINEYDLVTGGRVAGVYRCSVDALWAGTSGGFVFHDTPGTATVVDDAGLRTFGGAGARDFALGGSTLYWTAAGGVTSTTVGAAPHGRFGAGTDCG